MVFNQSNDFNNARSAIKLLEAWSLGTFTICSEVPEYCEYLMGNPQVGLSISNDKRTWIDTIRNAVDHFRNSDKQHVRIKIAESFTSFKFSGSQINIYKDLISEVKTNVKRLSVYDGLILKYYYLLYWFFSRLYLLKRQIL